MLRFALKNMLVRKTKLLLMVLSVVIAAGVALMAYNVSVQVQEGIVNTSAYYDMIIGPSGSATQLAMNTMFFTDEPLGTIPYEVVEKLQRSPQVNRVVPFTMGDSFNSARIIGTTPDFLENRALKAGKMFEGRFEAVVGAQVAEKYGLKLGDAIITSHGLTSAGTAHEASPLRITGILATSHTAYDNAVFTGIETVWHMHGLEEEGEEEEHEHAEGGVCAVLVKTKSFNAYYSLSQSFGKDASLLVINPATVLREVMENVDLSAKIVYALCGVILVMNVMVITVITLLNMYDARRDIQLMRLIGIRMGRIQGIFLIQNAIAGLISMLLALGVSMLGLKLMSSFVADMGIVLNSLRVYPAELAIMALVFAVSVLPTAICTWRMARKNGMDG